MLIQFRFQNFRSFRDDTILDLSATELTENIDHVTEIGGERILPAAAIYGANASGKTNVIEAFSFMQHYVLYSFGQIFYSGNLQRPLEKFALSPNYPSIDSTFEVYFTIEEENEAKLYNYGFTVGEGTIVEEWLNEKAPTESEYKAVFYRDPVELDLSGIDKKKRENLEVAIGKDTLIVSLGALLNIEICKRIKNWFSMQNIADFNSKYFNTNLPSFLPNGFDSDKIIQQNMVKYLSSFDSSIVGFYIRKNIVQDEKDYDVWALHRVIGSDKRVAIPLNQESAGTRKMMALYAYLQYTLEDGSVLFVDELSANLHPLLMRSILLMFLDPERNKHHAQLVFTTHDTLQLSENLLRRDEIWFTEKNADGVSTLYSLSDFVDEAGVKNPNYEKNYLLGKYGAIPTLKYLLEVK